MGPRIKTYRETVTAELAEAISSFNITEVADLLSDDGKFAVQNGKYEIVISDKDKFIDWLNVCYDNLFRGKFRQKLEFTIVKSMHCVTENQIIIFEEGRFPSFSDNQKKNEQSGLVVHTEENKIKEIELCLLVRKTENPFIYEKRRLRPR